MQTFRLLPLILLVSCATVNREAPVSLLGCWSNSEVETFREDGTKFTVNGECSRLYLKQRILVTCTGPKERQSSTLEFSYRLLSSDSYVQELVDSSDPAHLAHIAAYTKPHEFNIVGDMLVVVSYPDLKSNKPGRSVSKMVARFSRSGFQGDSMQCSPSAPS